MRLLGLIERKVFTIWLKVGEGDALLYVNRIVKRKQIGGLLLFIDPNDKKHSGSTDDLYSFTRPRNVQGCFPSQRLTCMENSCICKTA